MKTEPKKSNITGIYILIFVSSGLDGIFELHFIAFSCKNTSCFALGLTNTLHKYLAASCGLSNSS